MGFAVVVEAVLSCVFSAQKRLEKRNDVMARDVTANKTGAHKRTQPTMVSGTALFSLVGWSIVPDFATRQLLSFIHKTLANRLPRYSPPSQGTPAYRQHYAYTFAFVVLGYLLYNMIQSARALPPNFYEILGVASHVDENGLKAAFRQFAKWNHPDRPGVGEEGARMFMVVRESFEALKSPAVRFAYDR